MYQRNKICGSTSPWAENRAKRRDLLIIKNDLEPQAWEPRLLVLGKLREAVIPRETQAPILKAKA